MCHLQHYCLNLRVLCYMHVGAVKGGLDWFDSVEGMCEGLKCVWSRPYHCGETS